VTRRALARRRLSLLKIVYLVGLFADQRCGDRRAFALLQLLAKRLLFERQGHCITACGGLFRLKSRTEAHRIVLRCRDLFTALGNRNDLVGDGLLDVVGAVADVQSEGNDGGKLPLNWRT